MSLIYEPKGRAREYAALACNIYSGCDHGCTYCYAPSTLRKTRQAFSQPHARPHFLKKLRSECARTRATDPVLLCFTCDPYQHFDITEQTTRQTIQLMHQHNITVQVLTKGGSRALRDLDLFTPQDAFASTLTLLDNECTRKWEPRAALPQDRIDTIRAFHGASIPTWVSLEPVLNPNSALELIRRTHPFVNLFKVGKLNHHPLAQRIDWRAFANDAIALLESLGKPYLIKDDLKAYLD